METPKLSPAQDLCYFRLRRMQQKQPNRSFTMSELCWQINNVVNCRAQMIHRLRRKGLVARVNQGHLNPRFKIVAHDFIDQHGKKKTVAPW